jgi:hypothetical protein
MVTSPSKHHPTEEICAALGRGAHSIRVDEATLSRYYRYLRKTLTLPFPAFYPEPANSEEEREYRCTVIELIDPATGLGDEFDGLFCKVRKGKFEVNLPLIELELSANDPNFHRVENFWYWFWHWR